MKVKLIILNLFVALVIISCKKESKNTEITDKPLTFNVSIDFKISSDDDLILYYKDGTNEWFDDQNAIWIGVKGKPEVQNVVFNLPQGVLPNDLRLDIGRNEYKGLKKLEIKNIKLAYRDIAFEITENQIETYFKPNQFIVYDAPTKSYSFKKEGNKYDPFFECKPDLYPQLARLITN